MKTLYVTIFALFLFDGAYAQETIKADSATVGLKAFLLMRTLPIASAVESNSQGMVVIGFKIDDDHSITEVQVIKSLTPAFDAEVLREFKSYHQPILLAPSKYTAGVGLLINHGDTKGTMPPVDKSVYQNYLFDVIITADRRN